MVNTETAFDWGSCTNQKVLKYTDIISEIENPTGKVSEYNMNLFGRYEGLDNINQIAVNSIVTGRVISMNEYNVIIDINNKDNIVIERRGGEETVCNNISIGQEIDVLITKVKESPYQIKGTLFGLVKMKANKTILESYDSRTPLDAYVDRLVPAGYILKLKMENIDVDVFMPNTLADVNKLVNPESIVGQELKVMLETKQQDKGVFVVSRKRYLQSLIPQKIEEIRNNSPETVYQGHVTGVKPFGVFVQFEGCLTGMVHKVNLNIDEGVDIMSFEPGSQIDFFVKDIIKNGNQIILSQNLNKSLWSGIKVGDVIKGKVINNINAGTLISLDYETKGLIQSTHVKRNNKQPVVGSEIGVRVIWINRDERKIFLTFEDDKEMMDQIKKQKTPQVPKNDLDKLKEKFNS